MDETILKHLQEFHKICPSHVVLEKVDLVKVKAAYDAECKESGRTKSTAQCSGRSSTGSRNIAHSYKTSSRRSRHYVCYVCLQKFSSNSDLQEHKAVHDTDENLENVIYPVAERSLEIADTANNPSHAVASSENQMSKDVDNSVENPLSAYVFKCMTCSCYFKTGFNLFVHIRENKGKACKFHCDKCNKVFKYPLEFSQHIAHHLGNFVKRKRKCVNEKVDNKLDYKIDKIENRTIPNSLNTSKSSGQYNCVLCSRTFEDCFQLKRHLILGHKITEPQVTTLLNEQVAKRSELICKLSDSVNKPSESTGKCSDSTDQVSDTVSDGSVNKELTKIEEDGASQNITDDKKFTCNMCYDEFSCKEELEDHINLHLELNNPKERVEENGNLPSMSSANDVIVIDDEEPTSNKKEEVKVQAKKSKRKPKIKLKGVNVLSPNRQSLLKASLLKNNYDPLIFSSRPVQIVKSVIPNSVCNQSSPPMVLVSAPPKDPKNVKLLKTGPQSFQLCFDNIPGIPSTTATNVNVVTSANSLNLPKANPTGSFVAFSNAAQILNGPLIKPKNKTNALSATQPLTNPNLFSPNTRNKIPHSPSLLVANIRKVYKNVRKVPTAAPPKSNLTDAASPSSSSSCPSEALNCDNVTIMKRTEGAEGGVSPTKKIQVKKLTGNNTMSTDGSQHTVTNIVNFVETNSNKTTKTRTEEIMSSGSSRESSTNGNMLDHTAGTGKFGQSGAGLEDMIGGSTFAANNICKDGEADTDTRATNNTTSQSKMPINQNVTVNNDVISFTVPSVSQCTATSCDGVVGTNKPDQMDCSETQNADTGNESDDPGLVIDEGCANADATSAMSDESSSADGSHQPKIFVRKLSDLMEPEKLEKVIAAEKKKKLREKKCSDCNLVFVKHKTLRLHIKKKLSCIRCDYQTCKASQMKAHYQAKHDLYLCVRCRKIAENGYELYKHIIDVHTCTVCEHIVTKLETHKEKCTGPKAK